MNRLAMYRRLIEEDIEPHAAYVYTRLVCDFLDEEKARETEFVRLVMATLDRIPVTMEG